MCAGLITSYGTRLAAGQPPGKTGSISTFYLVADGHVRVLALEGN